MASGRYQLFETARGHSGIAWSDAGITRLTLPDADTDTARHSLLRKVPGAQPDTASGEIASVIDSIQKYFRGERIEFGGVRLDLGAQDEFFTRIYAAARAIGWGSTTTYGSLAKSLGAGPEAARDVGQAMARNPVPLIIPCHRVLAAGGELGGFSAPGGLDTKRHMLELEGVQMEPLSDKQRSMEF